MARKLVPKTEHPEAPGVMGFLINLLTKEGYNLSGDSISEPPVYTFGTCGCGCGICKMEVYYDRDAGNLALVPRQKEKLRRKEGKIVKMIKKEFPTLRVDMVLTDDERIWPNYLRQYAQQLN